MGSTTDKIKGTANEAIGKAKQGLGEATGNERLEGEGVIQEVKGKGQKAVGDAKEVTKDAINRAARAIAERGRNDQRALAADLHGGDTLVPALDDAALADRKIERLVAVDGGVEFLALLAVLIEPAGVVHDASLAGFRRGTGAFLAVDDLQS